MTPRPFVGAIRLALGRRDGIALFGDTVPAFLARLAPLVAFPLVGAGLLAASGRVAPALALLVLSLVAQLAPAVVSHALARWWGREAAWLRYATAFNWCQWALPIVAMGLLTAIQVVAGERLTVEAASRLLVLVVSAYGLWLNWLLARVGLDLGAGRAAGFVALVNLAVLALIVGPQLFAAVLE